MRKLTAILLALVMLLPLCLGACKDDSGMPPIGGDGTGDADGTETDGGNDPEDTNDNSGANKPNDTYMPDPTAGFGGWFAVGGENGTVYFDDIKTVASQNKLTLIENGFEGEAANLDGFTFKTADGGTWAGDAADWSVKGLEIASDDEEAEPTVNNVAAITTDTTGSMMLFGGQDWNLVQLSMKVMATEGTGGIKIYFGVTDEKNYYVLDIGGGNNSTVSVKHCVDGNVTTDTIDLVYGITYDTWFPVSLTLGVSTVKVYVAGTQLFEAYAEETSALIGGIGFGTWSTMYSIDNVKVTSYLTGDVLYENDFSNETLSDSDWTAFDAQDGEWTTLVNGGDWHDDWKVVEDDADHGNILKLDYVSTTMTGGAIMVTESVGNADWNNYIFEFDARKDGGAEGFMPYFAVEDITDPAKADFIRWNQGGWTNTQTCFQVCNEGSLGNGTQTANTYTNGQWYHITIYVIGNSVYGCVDGQLLSVYLR